MSELRDRRVPPTVQAGLAGALLTVVLFFLAQQFGIAVAGRAVVALAALFVGGAAAGATGFVGRRRA